MCTACCPSDSLQVAAAAVCQLSLGPTGSATVPTPIPTTSKCQEIWPSTRTDFVCDEAMPAHGPDPGSQHVTERHTSEGDPTHSSSYWDCAVHTAAFTSPPIQLAVLRRLIFSFFLPLPTS